MPGRTHCEERVCEIHGDRLKESFSLSPTDEGYPALLARIENPPDPLHATGSLLYTDQLAVAVVGSRTPTPYGRAMALKLSHGLARCGVTVVSGLARGIDTAAHSGALKAGGRTIAALGCGLDVDYPRGSGPLRGQIARRGAVLSEFPDGTPPLPHHFPRRNRIISGLALGVVVVEAGLRSGSLVTARWALDQGREVMTVPGRLDSPVAEGPLHLLRQGAAAVGSAQDILDCLGLGELAPAPETPLSASPLASELSRGPRTLEELCSLTGLVPSAVMAELSLLEVEGSLTRDPAGRYHLEAGPEVRDEGP